MTVTLVVWLWFDFVAHLNCLFESTFLPRPRWLASLFVWVGAKERIPLQTWSLHHPQRRWSLDAMGSLSSVDVRHLFFSPKGEDKRTHERTIVCRQGVWSLCVLFLNACLSQKEEPKEATGSEIAVCGSPSFCCHPVGQRKRCVLCFPVPEFSSARCLRKHEIRASGAKHSVSRSPCLSVRRGEQPSHVSPPRRHEYHVVPSPVLFSFWLSLQSQTFGQK